MSRYLVALLCLAVASPVFAQGPPPLPIGLDGKPVPAVKPPSPAEQKQIADLQKTMRELDVFFNEEKNSAKAAELLIQIESALNSTHPFVYSEGMRTITNNELRGFRAETVLKLVKPYLAKPETQQDRATAQGLAMEHVAHRYGLAARDLLPGLLRIVTDGTAPAYVRGQAIEATARIAPRDPAVVAAFIEAMENPNPKDTSGVHERAAEKLGDMGPAAWPAKAAIAKIAERGEWYESPAFLALGKLALDDPPLPLCVYLDRLSNLDRISLDQAAAAFLHVQRLCNPAIGPADPNSEVRRQRDDTLCEAARPVLLGIIEDHPLGDRYALTALHTLQLIGTGGSARAAKVLVRNLRNAPITRAWDLRGESQRTLSGLTPTDPAAVPFLSDGLDVILTTAPDDWVSQRTLALLLRGYGKEARSATPVLLRALERFKAPPQYPPYEALFASAYALAAVGADEPGARPMLLHLLDLNGPLLKKAGANAPLVQAGLLTALGEMGVPEPGEEREAMLDRLRAGLGGDNEEAFNAAARGIRRHGKAFTEKEGRSLASLLTRPLSDTFRFKPLQNTSLNPYLVRDQVPYEETVLGSRGLAIRALAALGSGAFDALPQLEALAARKVKDVRNTYLPEPPMNAVIREARKAVPAIKGVP